MAAVSVKRYIEQAFLVGTGEIEMSGMGEGWE